MTQIKHFFLIGCSIVFFCAYSNAQQLGSASTASEACFGCHKEQAKDWRTTWHSRSHIDSNSLYKAIVGYMSRITYQPEESVLVECAQCHNPKMTIKEIANKESFMLAKALNIQTNQTKKIDASVDDKAIKDGISCNICHNVAKVNESSDLKSRGFKAVEWGPADTIFGPFEEEGRTKIHKSVQKEHFTDPNKLCMACHFGGEKNGVSTYTTGNEYIKSSSQTKCVDCHMSPTKEGVIAPEIVKQEIKPTIRKMRSHLFEGARNSDILKDTIEINAAKNQNNLIVELKNLTPHKAPTGFGGRSIDVKVEFKNANSIIDTKTYNLETIYVNKKGQETIPYLAASIKADTRLDANEIRKLSVPIASGAAFAKITLSYRLASERLLKIINFSDKIFDKDYIINEININL